MNEQDFLRHHNLTRNPFADEDAQTDSVFKSYCIDAAFHPAWSKVFGDPAEPATAIVLGTKGSGKTAMRLQLQQHLRKYNETHPDRRVFVVEYDDFNRYLGPLQQSLPARSRSQPDKVLQSIQLRDHMDAILAAATTRLIDTIADDSDEGLKLDQAALKRLHRPQIRDLLLLAATYDNSRQGTFIDRFHRLRRRLGYSAWQTLYPTVLGWIGTLVAAAIAVTLVRNDSLTVGSGFILFAIGLVLAWLPAGIRFVRMRSLARRIDRSVRVCRQDSGSIRQALTAILPAELAAQPLPGSTSSDERYAMLEKLQSILRTLGFEGIIVLIDRVDEPELVNGQPERIRELVWPLLDNKLLKHQGIGFKLLLPSDLQYYLDRESREFNERARLDKQNVIRNFNWTGESLYELVNARLAACSDGTPPQLADLIDPAVSQPRLISALHSLRTPRSLFRFLFRLLMEHCKRVGLSAPSNRIGAELFETQLAIYQSETERDEKLV